MYLTFTVSHLKHKLSSHRFKFCPSPVNTKPECRARLHEAPNDDIHTNYD